MKKVIVGVTLLALVLSLSMGVMANEENDDLLQKRYELRKDFIKQQLKKDLITEQQAEYMLDRLEQMKEYYKEYGNIWDKTNKKSDELFQKRYELRKNLIKQQLEKGLIDKQQAEYMLNRLEQMEEYYKKYGNRSNGAYGGNEMPCGMMGGPGMMHGPGMMGGPGMMHGPGMMYGPGMMSGPGMMHGSGKMNRRGW